MHSILKDIVEKKKEDLQREKKDIFSRRFRDVFSFSQRLPIIGEIKLASPTEKFLGSREDILDRVIAYEKAGIEAISCITEKHYFHGNISFIAQIKEKVSLPVLQKDFVIDEYQIYEAKHAGSDALLLIARLVTAETLQKFVKLCLSINIEPVVEIASNDDLAKALSSKTNIIAVNARDLETFTVDVDAACELVRKVPTTFIRLGFSGIHSRIEIEKYISAGVNGVLVGTELMKAKDINGFVQSLL